MGHLKERRGRFAFLDYSAQTLPPIRSGITKSKNGRMLTNNSFERQYRVGSANRWIIENNIAPKSDLLVEHDRVPCVHPSEQRSVGLLVTDEI